MAIRIKLGSYRRVQSDALGRTSVGYFPRMTDEEVWEAGRGVWKMDADKAARQLFALIVAEGQIRAIGQITGVTVPPEAGRVALEGVPLTAGHPVYDRYIGTPDPVVNNSRNPVGYCELPEETELLTRPCACGCGEPSARDFLHGHDVRAIQARVRAHFDGSPLKFIEWVDARLSSADQPQRTR